MFIIRDKASLGLLFANCRSTFYELLSKFSQTATYYHYYNCTCSPAVGILFRQCEFFNSAWDVKYFCGLNQNNKLFIYD